MKRFALYLLLFFPLCSIGQALSQPLKINKLVIDSRKSHNLKTGDSVVTYVIDTLVMNDKSRLFLVNKKKVNLIVRYAIIGKDCLIAGNDGKNNGTDLTIETNFVQLKSLYISVQGEDAKNSNRHYNNGNGGQVILSYFSGGKKPQTSDKKAPGYLSIANKAGGSSVNAQTDVRVIMDQVRSGNPGRRLGQLPQGRIYSGEMGKDGSTSIKPVSSLPN